MRDIRSGGSVGSSATEILDLENIPSITGAVGYDAIELNLTDDVAAPARVAVVRSSGDLLGLLGVSPAIGRGFATSELQERRHLAIVSHRVWQARYAGDPGIIGSSANVQGVPYTIVGVMPSGFAFPPGAELWTIDAPYPGLGIEGVDRSDRRYSVLARLNSNDPTEALQGQLDRLSSSLIESYQATNRNISFSYETLKDSWTRPLRTPLMLLMGAAGAVLLIACANVVTLLLVRAASRENEFAIRKALGASSVRLRTQLILEAMIVTLGGWVVGVIGAVGGLVLIQRLLPVPMPIVDPIAVDGRVALATLCLTIIVGFVVAVISSNGTSSSKTASPLGQRGFSRSRKRIQLHAAVATQIALGTVVTIGGVLFFVSLQRLSRVDPGFDPARLATIRLHNGTNGRGTISFWAEVVSAVQQLPGISGAAGAAFQPIEQGFGQPFSISGIAFDVPPTADFVPVVGDFVQTVGGRMLDGRIFTPADDADSHGVAIVNESFVRRYLVGRRAVGTVIKKSMAAGAWGIIPELEVVGVIGDMPNRGLRVHAEPLIMVPHAQAPFGYMRLFVRSEVEFTSVVANVQEAIWKIDPELPVNEVQTMEDIISASLQQERFLAAVTSIFSTLSLALSAFGVAGVIGHSVSQRLREMGIRVALGAIQWHVVGLIFKESLTTALVGVTAGFGAPIGMRKILEGQLYDISPTDPGAMIVVGLAFLGITVLASYAPARRIMRLDPVQTLRSD